MKNLTDNNLLEIKTRLKNTFPNCSFKVTKSADDEELYINVLESDFKISDYYFRNTKQLNITKLEDYPKENNKEYETLKEILSIAKSEGYQL